MSADAPSQPDGPKPHINIFALPQQTTILSIMIVLVIFGVLLSISAGTSPVELWPVLVIIAILSVRGLVAKPEHDFHQYQLVPAGETFAPLQQRIHELCEEIQLTPVPQLLIAQKATSIATSGSLRRWYIFAGEAYATWMLENLQHPQRKMQVHAILLHELHHFQHGDNIRIGYVYALLRASYRVMLWALLFLMGWITLLIIVADTFLTLSPADLVADVEATIAAHGILGIDLPSDLLIAEADLQEMQQQIARTDYRLVLLYAITNTLGVFLVGLVLIALIWRKLLRIREYYADARVAHIQKTIQPLMFAHLSQQRSQDNDQSAIVSLQWLTHAQRRVWEQVPKPVCRLFVSQPAFKDRFARLRGPATIYDSGPRLALFIGIYGALLWFLLANTSLYHISDWPLHFLILTTYILISLGLIVQHVQGRHVRHEHLTITAITLLPHTILLGSVLCVLWVGLLFAPAMLADFLDAAIAVTARYAGIEQQGLSAAAAQSFVIEASIINLLQIPVMFGIIALAIWGQSQVTRRVLTWYSFPQAEHRLMRVITASIALMALVLALGVLPLVASIILPSQGDNMYSPLFWASVGGACVLGLAGGLWFRQQDQRYAQQCPCCKTPVPDTYAAGNTCPTCHCVLHPWLLVQYDTEGTR
ncbi:MAG: hypothetical protein GYB64_05535 [Chloroflexi bacterium]|nr:hypothetical protein [Chloroflexota bacterium]